MRNTKRMKTALTNRRYRKAGILTREQAKQNLINLGVAEPTDEQVTNYLNQVGGETKKEKDRADRLKADADKVAELQRQLDELNSQNLTDIEKANKATEAANQQVEELQKQLKKLETMKQLAEKGITGDDAEQLFNEDGSLNFETFGKILTERATNAANEKEKELLNNTPNPTGSSGGNPSGSEPEDVANAKTIGFGADAVKQEIKDYYKL